MLTSLVVSSGVFNVGKNSLQSLHDQAHAYSHVCDAVYEEAALRSDPHAGPRAIEHLWLCQEPARPGHLPFPCRYIVCLI